MVALVAASCMFAAAAPSWTQTNLPAANVGLPQSTSVTPATTPPTPIAKPTANPSLRMPKDLALPARANPLAPVDIAQENAGDIEKTFDNAAYRRAVKNGQMALRNQEWDNAAVQLQEALTLNPNSK